MTGPRTMPKRPRRRLVERAVACGSSSSEILQLFGGVYENYHRKGLVTAVDGPSVALVRGTVTVVAGNSSGCSKEGESENESGGTNKHIEPSRIPVLGHGLVVVELGVFD